MQYYHCSFDVVETNFVPRIPQQRAESEDAVTPRICAASTLSGAVRSIPQSSKVIQNMQALGLPVVLHVYKLETEREAYMPTKEEVPDVKYTGEIWLLKPPLCVTREEVLVKHPKYAGTGVDGYGYLLNAEFCPTKKQSNFQNLGERFGVDCEKLRSFGIQYRTFISNLEPEDISRLNEKRGIHNVS